MRVLLTGASGFLGAHLLRNYLRDTDWEFVCPVTFRHRGLPERIDWAMRGESRGDPHDRVTIVRHDCATPVNATTARLFGDIDLILNLASDTHPPRSVLQPVEFVHNNVDITLYLLEYARTHGKPMFVQVSTNSVYGPAYGDSSHPEWDPIIPNNPYGASKAAQEALAISYWRSYRMPVMIAATMNPIGVLQDLEKYIPMVIDRAIRGEKVEVHAAPDGSIGSRSYIHADDVAAGLRHALALPNPGYASAEVDRPARWNVSNDTEVNNLRVVELVEEALGRRIDCSLVQVDRPEHGHRYSMSSAALRSTGWGPKVIVEDAIFDIARWTAENPLWLAR